MRKLIIYGAGGFGRETALMVDQINDVRREWDLIGFLDDNLEKGVLVDDRAVLGGIQELETIADDTSVAIAIAHPHTRMKIRSRIRNQRISFPSLIHPSALLGDEQRNRIAEGVIIAARNVLTTNIRIQSFVIVNIGCTIGHDAEIGSFSSMMPSCSISGAVCLEQGVEVGTGASILPGLRVGRNSRVGAGAVVTRDVPPDVTVVGIPARAVVGNR